MKKFKTIIIPYDKKAEEKQRESFWKSQHQYHTNRGVVSLDELKEQGIEISDNGESIKEIEDRVDVELVMKRLTPRQREVIQLRMDGYTYKEIAEKMGISEQGAKDHHMKANRRLLAKK